MKKLFSLLFVALMAISLAFVGCRKDTGGGGKNDGGGGEATTFTKIEATNVEAYNTSNLSAIDEAYAIIYDDGSDAYKIIKSGKFSNKSFTLEFPATVTDFLYKVSAMNGLTPSDKDALFVMAWLEANDKDGNYIGDFGHYGLTKENQIAEFYIYLDRDCNVSGTDGEGFTWNASGKKGWNKLYIDANAKKVTSSQPSGYEWHWVYFQDGVEKSNSMFHKNFISKKNHR